MQSQSTSSEREVKLTALKSEAKNLFKALDQTSNQIRSLEKSLSELKAHFPFSLFLKQDKSNSSYPLDIRHWHPSIIHGEEFCLVRPDIHWFLKWEKSDERSGNYRLFLISKIHEVIVWARDGEELGVEFEREVLFKRPLIETDLATRLQFSKYIPTFILQFTEYLREYRVAIDVDPPPSLTDHPNQKI